ncbi:prolipoprotein diacylglyceryl transferase [Corynebacterium sp.]|uniref:prolipoprotein diacylglyceryl transferase n=1 Tax=Corynebacterium sp. TaxID=1720 RepID=UPI0026DDAFBC|nr:prolipoprotein diacylglyceryl transferase [Corynebacterium sp.]MDO4609202.1 prolipoprotein diacylglyceryl transferase [Corynebacterium sp.]
MTTTDLLAYIPSPPQGVWHLGPLPIRGYAMCILVGIVAGLLVARKRYKDRGGDPDLMIDIAIAAVPGGIIGGRIYHLITDWEKYFAPGRNPWQALDITAGGLGIWGAVVGGVLAGWAVVKWRKVPAAPALDTVAPAIILGQAFGRLGNWFNQELYGGPTTLPWGLEIYLRVDEAGRVAPVSGVSTGEVLAVVHPTFLYELLWNLVVFFALLWADRRFRLGGGRVFALYVACYTFGRFFIEAMRTDPATTVFGDIRINNVVSLVVFVIAVAVFVALRNRRREHPAFVRGETKERDGGGLPAVSRD